MALAGPAVSAALGTALAGAGQIGVPPAAVASVLEWLGWTNLLLLSFNMIPALPLDGGRLLRAALWRYSGNLVRATGIAARVSQVLALGLICFAAVSFLASGALGGLWLAFVGWFVFSAATAERGGAEAQVALDGVQVAELMTPDPTTVPSTASAGDLLELRRQTGHSVYPVIDEHGDAVGLVSAHAAEQLPQHRRNWVTVRELLAAAPDPLALDAEADALTAIPALVGNPLHRAAVLRAGRLVGLLALSDVSQAVRLRAGGAAA